MKDELKELQNELAWCEMKLHTLPSFLSSHRKDWQERIDKVTMKIKLLETESKR